MNKVEELIEKFCPEGVEYKKISDICSINRGRVMSKDYLRENVGNYPVYSSQTADNGVLGSISTYDFDGEYLSWTTDGANAGTIFYRIGKFSVTNVCGLLKVLDKTINIRFLFYTLGIEAPKHVNQGMGNPKLMSNVMADISIPVPPLPIQEAIVKILDNFSSLTAELQAELQARKWQYEFYRNQLLSFDREDADTSSLQSDVSSSSLKEDDPQNTTNAQGNFRVTTTICKPRKVKWMRLGDIGTLTRGGNFQKKDFMDEGIGCIHYGQIYTYYGTYTDKVIKFLNSDVAKKQPKAKKGDLVITLTSENIEDVCKSVAWLGDKEIAVSGHAAILHHNQNSKYLAYYLQTKMFFDQKKKYARGAKVIEMQPDKLATIEIPIPPLSEQQRIVSILDHFDALINDISTGLPAEIAARQQQYEYYRDKLLTFKRKEA